MTMTLWSDMREDLQTAGASQSLQELVRRATAPARCIERINATIDAAKAAFTQADDTQLAWEIAADLNGVGGYFALGGNSRGTIRAEWAQLLGKGRWRAGDGGAWEQASHDAICRLIPTKMQLTVENNHLRGNGKMLCPTQRRHQNLLTRGWLAAFYPPREEMDENDILRSFLLTGVRDDYIPLLNQFQEAQLLIDPQNDS